MIHKLVELWMTVLFAIIITLVFMFVDFQIFAAPIAQRGLANNYLVTTAAVIDVAVEKNIKTEGAGMDTITMSHM